MSGLDAYCPKSPTCTGCPEEPSCDEQGGRDLCHLVPAGIEATFTLPHWTSEGRVEPLVIAALEAFPKDSFPHTSDYRLEYPGCVTAYLGTNAGMAAPLAGTYRSRLEALLQAAYAQAAEGGLL